MDPMPHSAPASDATIIDTGESLAGGRYVIYGRLGHGSQAETLRAVDKRLGQVVAVKRFSVGHAKAWKDVELAEREARILSSLNHPALPRYFDHFEESGCLYLVMECIEGESLAQYSKRGQRLDLIEVRRLLGTLSDVLDYLHSRVPPVIHRDIKPGNIIRRPDGSFCLVDFGSVRDGLRPEGGSTVVGTFGYMAPEQFQGRALPSTDVFAVGVLLLTLFTGKSPEELPHHGLAIDAAAALAAALPTPWVNMIAQLVNIDPDQRPSSLVAVLQALDQVQHGPTEHTAAVDAGPAKTTTDSEARDPDAAFTIMVGSGLGLIPLIALTIARIAIWFALGVVVPLVLYLLSMVFGGRLREIAGQVVQAGQSVRVRLADISQHLQRAEPFILQGRHYGRRKRRNRARGWPLHRDWHDAMRMRDWRYDWRNEADWRQHMRIDTSEPEPGRNDDQEHPATSQREPRRDRRR
jgi:hypothetical protein